MVSESGSKSQLGFGVPAATDANKSANGTADPKGVTFRQKPGPSAALNVAGSHSSKATTSARLCGACAPAAAGLRAIRADPPIKNMSAMALRTAVILILWPSLG